MDIQRFENQMARIIPSFAGFTAFVPTIPKMYWDVKSQEQRILGICKMLDKVICYADMLGENVDEIAKTLQDIEDGKLDDFIVAAIDVWFEQNQPQLQNDVNSLKNALPLSSFSSVNTVKKKIEDTQDALQYNIDQLGIQLSGDISTTNGNVTALQTMLAKYGSEAVIVGDSWSTDNYGVTEANLWWTRVCKELGVTPHNYSVSGMGYLQGQVNFWDRLQTAHDDSTFDNNHVGYVFLQGSLNDGPYYTADANNYGTKVENTINRAKSYFPNARIIVMSAQNHFNCSRVNTNMMIMQKQRCLATGVAFMSMVWVTPGLDYATDPNQSYHPSQTGQQIIAGWVMSNLCGTPLLINRDFALDEATNFRYAGSPSIKLRHNTLYLEAAGSSTSNGLGSLTFANNILQSLEYFETYILGHTLVNVGHITWAQMSTTAVNIKDTELQGTVNNAWYYGQICDVY